MKWLPLALAATIGALAADDPAPYGKFLDLGSHRVHYDCQGQGTQTVILLTGTPRFSFHFVLIQPGIARFARVCTYDRAGDAWTEPLPDQPQAQQFVDELDEVLGKLSPRAPVVIVGHSVGGVLGRAYFAQHSDRVSAMVMIDTAPVDGPRSSDEQMKALAAAAKPQPTVHTKLAKPFTLLPARWHAAHLWATDKWYRYAAGVDTYVALKYQADLYSLANLARSGSLPIWFIARARTAESQEPWIVGQTAMASAWPKAKLIRAVGSGHDIQLERPGIVIETVRAAVAEVAKPNRR